MLESNVIQMETNNSNENEKTEAQKSQEIEKVNNAGSVETGGESISSGSVANSGSESEPTVAETKKDEPSAEYLPGVDMHLYGTTLMYAGKLKDEKIDITQSFFKWQKIADGLINSFGAHGRKIFHTISSAAYPTYSEDETNKFFSAALKKERVKGRIQPTAQTVIRFAREAGALFYRDRVKGKKDNGNELAFKIIQEKYVSVFDELSQDYLVNGKPIDDVLINTILVDLMVNHRIDTTKEFVQSVIESSFTERVNQFHDFVEKYRHHNVLAEENIQKLAKCIHTRTARKLGRDYKLDMIRLFLVKMVVQIFENVPNDLCLILLGGPFLGKTEFFKRLLPEELSHMFSVQAFRGDKDAKRDAARYLLILDDEFRGLKLATSETLKSQLSMTTINLRVPYGRKPHPFKRIASYCAVSNERFILKDVTGNRRLICFWVDSLDWELYNSINKVDLLMEAFHHYEMGYGHELDRQLLNAIDIVSKEFEVSTSAEELMMQYMPPASPDNHHAVWMPVSKIIHEIDNTHKVKLSEYEVGKALRKLNYKHKYLEVNGSKLLCWLTKDGNTDHTNFNNIEGTDTIF